MKKILLLTVLMFPMKAHSQAGLSYTLETASKGGNTQTISITSATSVNVTSATAAGIIYGAYAIEVYNVSGASATINCGVNNVNVSTVTSGPNAYGPNYGREIPPGVGMVFHVLQNKVPVYCRTQSVVGVTPATITQLQ